MGCSCGKNAHGKDIRDLYKIGAILGSGSFGQVRACVKKSNNQNYAVKIMSKDPPKEKRGSNNVDFAMMFKNEVAILHLLDHPNVIKLFEFYEDRHYLYAILDKCEGGELFAHIVKKRRFSEQDAAGLCLQMLQAIQYVHHCGIIHRDIKAENFMFSKRSLQSRLILIDFGMSVKVNDEKYLKQLCGSPHYVAPELIRRNYQFKVDMWALGVVIFLMLFGRYPFEGSDQKAIVQAILNAKPDYTSRSITTTQTAIDFINALLEKDPDKRLSPEDALQHPWIITHTQQHAVEVVDSHQDVTQTNTKKTTDVEIEDSAAAEEDRPHNKKLCEPASKNNSEVDYQMAMYTKPKVIRRFQIGEKKL